MYQKLLANSRACAIRCERLLASTNSVPVKPKSCVLCSTVGGRFFLPYQLHYTAAQLERAYPEIGAFFAAKRRLDPTELFVNTFYERFGK